ncbi:hypothetical protein [Streptomyces sp. NA02950]|uniref:MmyB family transcriptional regulator n=1 Tax=Streptomyces sp. NA02950 TaxID=2742137 RepID=UPI0020CAC0FC|nr:hypothetical protein [Streptomyces sp. NA02950]
MAVAPEMRRLLDAWSPRPGCMRGRHGNFTAVNDAVRGVFGYSESDHNCLVSFFTNVRYRVLHQHWAETAPDVAAAFRARRGALPRTIRSSAASPLTWPRSAASSPSCGARHDVAEHTSAVKAVDYYEAGAMVFGATLLPLPEHPGHHLILHNPRPGTETQRRLETLMRQHSLVVPHPG